MPRPFEAMSSYALSLVVMAGLVVVAVLAADGEFGPSGLLAFLVTSRAVKILAFRAGEFEKAHQQRRHSADPP